jgi:hypothetical protein
LAEAMRAALTSPPATPELAEARQSVVDRFGVSAGLARFGVIVRQVISPETTL